MKKLISLLLCALMITSLSLTAFAAPASESKGNSPIFPASTSEPGAEVQASCPHANTLTMDAYVNTSKFDDQGNGTCANPAYNRTQCVSCKLIFIAPTPSAYVNARAHSGSPYASSCNGTTQTWRCACSRCGTNYTETHACPGAGHGSTCRWLPV